MKQHELALLFLRKAAEDEALVSAHWSDDAVLLDEKKAFVLVDSFWTLSEV